MKTASMLVGLLLAGSLASSCATLGRLNAEYEEEVARFEAMTQEQKAEFEESRRERNKINWNEYIGGGDDAGGSGN